MYYIFITINAARLKRWMDAVDTVFQRALSEVWEELGEWDPMGSLVFQASGQRDTNVTQGLKKGLFAEDQARFQSPQMKNKIQHLFLPACFFWKI